MKHRIVILVVKATQKRGFLRGGVRQQTQCLVCVGCNHGGIKPFGVASRGLYCDLPIASRKTDHSRTRSQPGAVLYQRTMDRMDVDPAAAQNVLPGSAAAQVQQTMVVIKRRNRAAEKLRIWPGGADQRAAPIGMM